MGNFSIEEMFRVAGSELLGMFLLLLLGNGVVATVSLSKTKGTNTGSNWLVIGLGWFSAIFISVFITISIGGQKAGAHLNPVMTINQMLLFASNSTKGIPPVIGILTIIFQIIGAALGQLALIAVYKKQFDATKDANMILNSFSTGPAIKDYKWNLVGEIIGTFVLVLGVSSIKDSSDTSGAMTSMIVGILVFGIGISIGSATGYALNPTRDLIPRIIHQALPLKNKGSSNWLYSWVPVVGPLIGGILALLCAPGLFY